MQLFIGYGIPRAPSFIATIPVASLKESHEPNYHD